MQHVVHIILFIYFINPIILALSEAWESVAAAKKEVIILSCNSHVFRKSDYNIPHLNVMTIDI